ncbi:hypothetical protein Cni_G11572 [Canna indica]|uniref:Uncharacterized protein n=1 Tax=Canna indica TaxID=4628 RepID=A0AAQ3K6B0_9LILI|nr:hypothetical protein Cni_G11572 [Canna indica]
MSSGAFDLLLFGAVKIGVCSQQQVSSASAIIGALAFLLFLLSSPRMRQRPEGSKKTDSMRYTRVGFGVKYFGFQHIDLCCFLFIFLRRALT